jgi:protein subunit release factor A
MKTNLEQRLAVALVSNKLAASLLAKCDSPAELSKAEKDALVIALADKKAGEEVSKVLEARASVVAKTEAKTLADAAKVAADTAAAEDEEDEELAAAAEEASEAATAAAADLTAAQAAKAALVPMSRNAKDRIIVALADKKAGDELIAKIQA